MQLGKMVAFKWSFEDVIEKRREEAAQISQDFINTWTWKADP